MPVEHKAAQSMWRPAVDPGPRYPTHNLQVQSKDSPHALITICNAALLLPEQVPARGAEPGYLYCIGCSSVVAATSAQVAASAAAAAAEGFVAAPPKDAPVLPGMLDSIARAGLYWAHRLPSMSAGHERDTAQDVIAKAKPSLAALGLYEGASLTPKGHELAALVADPPVDPRLARTDDPALAGKRKEKRLPRAKRIELLIPRCAIRSCFRPLPRDGACKCGHTETSEKRLAEIGRCWDIVDAENPVKPRREKKAKVKAGVATA